MELKPGYEMTELGAFPKEWRIEPLACYASFRTGPFGSALHKSDYKSDGIPVVNPMHIVDGKIEPTRTMSVTELAAEKLADFRMRSGEVVIGRRGDMGRCAVVQEHQSGWLCGTGSMIIRPRNLDADFLQRLLSSPRVISAIEDSSVGTTMVNLNQGILARLKVQLPPLPEQRAIAKALSDVDALLDGLERLIGKKRDLKQAAMQQLLAGQSRLPGFEGGWRMRALRDLVCQPITDGPHLTPRFLSEGVPFLSVNNIVGNRLDLGVLRHISREDHREFSKKCSPRRGDILFGKAASVGVVALIDTDMELNIWSPLALIRVGKGTSGPFVFH